MQRSIHQNAANCVKIPTAHAHVLKFDALPVCHTACPEEAESLKTFFFVETILGHGSLFQGSDEV